MTMKSKLHEIPFDIGSEGGVIGAVIKEPKYIPQVVEFIGSEDFYVPQAKRIFEIVRGLWSEGHPVDPVIVRSKFRVTEKEELLEFLINAFETVPCPENAIYYAKIVRQKSQERNLIRLVEETNSNVEDTTMSVEEKITSIARILSQPQDFHTCRDKTMAEIIDGFWAQGKQQDKSIPTGFAMLDRLLGGFRPGQLILVGGPPSMGKSSLVLDFFIHSLRVGANPYFISLEMLDDEIAERMIHNVARCKTDFSWTDPDVMEAVRFIIQNPGTVAQRRENQIDALCAGVLAKKQIHNIGIAYVDHLHLIRGPGKSIYEQRTYVSQALKSLAMQAQIPIVAAAQLNRAGKHRNNKRPVMSDLRDSGSLEQDADVVMLLYSEDYYRNQESSNPELDGLAECIVAKARNRPTGVMNLIWFPEFCSFKERAQL